MIPNRTIIGNRGSGKSVTLEAMMTEVAADATILLLDWPGTLADRMTGRMKELGLESRVIADKAMRTDAVPQWSFRSSPRSDAPLTRKIEERAANENLLLACFARRHQKDAPLSPLTYRSALAAVEVYYGIPEDVRPTLDRVVELFRFGSPVGRWMLDATADQGAASVFRDAMRLAARSPQQWEILIGPGGRLLEPLTSPAVWPRNGRSLDWKAFVRDRRHYYLAMEGLDQTTAATLAILAYTPAIHAARELFEETGRAHPLVVVLEEAGALGLVTPVILTAMQAYRKHGVSVWVASQTVHDFRDEATFEAVLAMSEHYWHQMTAGVDRAARDCADPTYEPGRVLHARERPIVRRYERVATRTVRVDPKGWLSDQGYGSTFRPVIGVEVQETYDNPANHEAEIRRALSTLRVGERVVRGLDGSVCREAVALPADPWGPFADEEITLGGKSQTLARHRLDTALKQIRRDPIYQPPASWTLPPLSPPPSEPSRTRTRPTDEGPGGMRGS